MNAGYSNCGSTSKRVNPTDNQGAPSFATKAAEPVRDTLLSSIGQELHGRLITLRDLSCRLDALGDRLLGVVPTGSDSSVPAPCEPGEVGNLASNIPFADYLIGNLAAQINRLERL